MIALPPTPWRCLLPLYLLYLLALPAGMVWVESRPLDGPTICAFRLVTHLDCPSCGLTRAFRAMGRLDVRSAFRYNPLGPAIFLVAVGWWGYTLAWIVTRGRIHLPAWWVQRQYRIITWAVIIFLLVGIGRICYEMYYPPPPPQVSLGEIWWLHWLK